jgi:hypothetical protein
MAELRRLPSAGDRLTVGLDAGSVDLEVVSVARRVAEKILIRATPVPAPRPLSAPSAPSAPVSSPAPASSPSPSQSVEAPSPSRSVEAS